MNIQRADTMGFCSGVRSAVALALQEADRGPLALSGELVHNGTVSERLLRAGLRGLEPGIPRVMITAHGASDRAVLAFRARGLVVLDATCPLVRRAHRALAALARDGYHPVIIGKRGHVEVRGLAEDHDGADILESEEDVPRLTPRTRFGVVAQTTQEEGRVRAVLARMAHVFPQADVRYVDTICRPTKDRQRAAAALARASDAVVVVGDAHSNNTLELTRACLARCPRVHRVAGPGEIDPAWFAASDRVGLTAGASAPDDLIDAVESRLREIARALSAPRPARPDRPVADVLIAGAGFAGLACAASAARAGLRTVVLDGKPEPGAQVRTTGIFVQEAQDEWRLPSRLVRAVNGVRLYAPSLRSVDLNGNEYKFFATDTPGVLRWLAGRAASAGADLRWGEAYAGARRGGPGILSSDGRWAAGVLVGADGARSRVARDFGLGRNRRFLFGTEVEWEGVGDIDPDRLHCFITRDFAPGYIGWAVPGLCVTQVGLAGVAPFRPRLEEFLRRLRRVFNFDRARPVSRRAGFIPIGGPVSPDRADGVLLVGDAAGQVSPLTAGGIRLALERGDAAGRDIARRLAGERPEAIPRPRFGLRSALRLILERAFPDVLAEGLLTALLFRKAASAIFF